MGGISALGFRDSLLSPTSLNDMLFGYVLFSWNLLVRRFHVSILAILGSLFYSSISSFLVGSFISRSKSICTILLLRIRLIHNICVHPLES
jgi:hypothetical protein